MKVKKSDRAKLENKRFIFFEIGLILALLLLLTAFEWNSSSSAMKSFESSDYTLLDEEFTPITRPEMVKPAPPLPKPVEIIDIIPDDEIPLDEYLGEDVEPAPSQPIELPPYVEPEVNDEPPFPIVEDMPTFRGGDLGDFRTWVMRNLQYPEIAVSNRVSGKVIVKFVVGINGEVEDIVVLRGADPSLDREAVRVISSSPRWTPGKQRNKPVRVLYVLPVNFVLK